MKWLLPLPSSAVSTLLVLVLDVVSLWILDLALLRVAVFLTAREVYDSGNAVKVSDVWFESITGRAHGPLWFRKAQVALKVFMLACSIAVGLSIDGFTRQRQVILPGQYVLARQERRMADSGIGTGYNNFSSDVLFVREGFACSFSRPDSSSGRSSFSYWNARSLVPASQTRFGDDASVECMSKKNGFTEPIVLRTENRVLDTRHCRKIFPYAREIKSGVYRIDLSKCPWRATHFHCQMRYKGGCALTLELGGEQVLVTVAYKGRADYSRTRSTNYRAWRKRDAEAVRLMAMYIDHGLTTSPDVLDHVTSFQTAKRTMVQAKGSQFATEINVPLFLIGLIILLTIVVWFVLTALTVHSIQVRKIRSDYALGFRVAEVARFAHTDVAGIQGETLFLKQHSDFPRLTVSGNATNCGDWMPSEVLGVKK